MIFWLVKLAFIYCLHKLAEINQPVCISIDRFEHLIRIYSKPKIPISRVAVHNFSETFPVNLSIIVPVLFIEFLSELLQIYFALGVVSRGESGCSSDYRGFNSAAQTKHARVVNSLSGVSAERRMLAQSFVPF